VKLLSAEEVLYLHHRLIEETGGSHGVRELGLLQSAVQSPSSGFGDQEFYPSLFEKAAVIMRSIVQNHPFVDGNKRTGISAAAMTLGINGYELTASQQEFEDFAVLVATDHPSVEEIAEWLRAKSIEVVDR
jgi:death-on-curing protein